jgi:hypothetical protein
MVNYTSGPGWPDVLLSGWEQFHLLKIIITFVGLKNNYGIN